MKTLQDIVSNIEPNDPAWYDLDLAQFSPEKTLFEFQQKAIENAIKALWLYYYDIDKVEIDDENEDDKYERIKKEIIFKYQANNIPLENTDFANRMSFWMATGSGKTLVIIKLIEILGQLISVKSLPERDILFLAHRDNLIEQFKLLVDEFNQCSDMRINLISLRDYDSTKNQFRNLIHNKIINVFYYRSDLFSDEAKKSIIDYKNYDNNGKWYILLDEAHKGDREESKRQQIYSKLSKHGFLFNFSATFTDQIDEASCVYNFNLEKFIDNGYGKKIYVSKSDVEGFEADNDFSNEQKQEIVLKTLILQTHIVNNFGKIKKADASLYHKPLLLTLVNSVNPKMDIESPSDLKMFFTELANIAEKKIRPDLFQSALESLAEEMSDSRYFFGGEEIKIKSKDLLKIKYEDVLKKVFNTKTPGKLECLKTRGNNQELIFRVKTSVRKPFALIKIGDVSKWVRDMLSNNIEITERLDEGSEFANLNSEESDINILMGSRVFYEGWDSNRPNIVLFINIGKAAESRKFVLQSIGRGIRIEPQKNKRTRLEGIKGFDDNLRNEIKDHFNMLESLFVFGTNSNTLNEIIETMRKESSSKNIGDIFEKNSDVENRLLLMPTYKESKKLLAKEDRTKHKISLTDLQYSRDSLREMGEKISIAKLNCDPKSYKTVEKAIDVDDNFHTKGEKSANSPSIPLRRIFSYFNLHSKEVDKFNEVTDDDIVHFKRINLKGDEGEHNDLLKQADFMKKLPENKEKFGEEAFNYMLDLFKSYRDISIKHIANHYYHPIFVSSKEKIDYLNHIISVKSERVFIEELESKLNNLPKNHDWWMFSKLDETLDKIHIPYFNHEKSRFANFNPDFIFWMQKGKEYSIVFVDPKGFVNAEYQEKIKGYTDFFEESEKTKNFKEHGVSIKVHLCLFTHDSSRIIKKYRPYWIDNVEDIFNL